MIVSCYTAGDSALSRVHTHNAGVGAESLALTDGPATDYPSVESVRADWWVQKRTHVAQLAGLGIGQCSSTVEHSTHNGEVAGSAPATGIAVLSAKSIVTLALASQGAR